jgi:hypothetical protein
MKAATEERTVVAVEEEVVEATTVVELALEADAPTNAEEDSTRNNMKLHYSFKSYL